MKPIAVNLGKVVSVFGCEKSIVKWKHLLYDVEQLIQIVSTKEVFPMSILTQVCDNMQKLLTHTANEAARHCGLVQRHRKLTGSALVQTLVFGWFANPEASYDELAQTAGTLGIAVSRQAIEQRLTPEAAETLKATLESAAQQAIASEPDALPLLNGFNGVYLQDSTWIPLPDVFHDTCKGTGDRTNTHKAALKLQLRLEVASGEFEHFQLTEGITADSTAEKQFQPLPEGSLRLADLGYFSLEALAKLTQANVSWITRLKAGCRLFDEAGDPLCLLKWLQAQPQNRLERHLRIGKTKQLPARLIAEKLSEQETNKRRRDIRRRAKRRNISPSTERLRLAGWNLYLTNIDEHRFTPEQILVIARVRWQIELMFKCFKSVGKVHVSRSQKPYRILCEVYAKLIAALLRHWGMLVAGWRCTQHSLMKTATLIGTYARALTASFHRSRKAFCETFEDIKRTFQNGCYLESSPTKPTTFKRLQAAEEN